MEVIPIGETSVLLGSLQVWKFVCEVSCWHKNLDPEFLNSGKIHFSDQLTNRIGLNLVIVKS